MSQIAKTTIATLMAAFFMAVVVNTPTYADEEENWNALKEDLFGSRQIEKAAGRYKLFVDSEVKDAALMPVSIRLSESMVPQTNRIYLLVDNNPAPIAAVFELGDAYRTGGDIGERNIDTRIRMNEYSKVRAVFETADGKLFMADAYAAGAGGCSSAPAKDVDKILAQLGRMKIKLAAQPAISEAWRQATVMIRHPNFTGMQVDEKKGGFTPAWYVEKIDVMSAGKMVFRLKAGISLSADPNLRFTYAALDDAKQLSVSAVDTKGKQFYGKTIAGGS